MQENRHSKTSEESFKALFNSVMEAIYIQDENGVFLDVNEGAVQMYGYEREDFIGKTPEFVSAPGMNDMAMVSEAVARAFSGEKQQFEYWGLRKSGEIFPKEVNLYPGIYFGRKVVIALAIDITLKKKNGEILAESELRYKTLFNGSPDAIFLADVETGMIIDANESALRLLGKTHEEIRQMHQTELHPPELISQSKESFRHFASIPSKIEPVETVLLATEGKRIPVEILATTLVINGRQCLQGVFRDISDRKQAALQQEVAQKALRASEDEHRAIFRAFPDLFFRLDQNGIIIGYRGSENAKYYSPPEEFLGKQVTEVLPKTISEPTMQNIRKALETQSICAFEYCLPEGGEPAYYESRIIPLGQQEVLAVIRNITDRKRNEIARLETEERYRGLVESTSDLIWETNLEGLYTYVSPQIEDILGYSVNEALHHSPFAFSVPQEKEYIQHKSDEIFRAKEPFYNLVNRMVHKGGHIVHLETSGVPYFDASGNLLGYRGVSRDVSRGRKSEEELRKSEEKYRKLHESMIDGFVYRSMDGTILECNPSYSELTGYKSEELLGMNSGQIIPEKYHALELSLVLNQIIPFGYSDLYEMEYRHKQGGIIPVEMRTFLIRNDYGIPQGMWTIVRDITERKRAEIIRQIQYNVMNQVVISDNLENIYETVRSELGKLIDTTNFIVAFYDDQTRLLSSLYEADIRNDSPSVWPAEKSLTGKVIHDRHALVLGRHDIQDMADSGEIDLYGSLCESWLGVPLVLDGNVIGALVLQDYTKPGAYDRSSLELVELIAHELTIFIQRKHAEVDLMKAKIKAEESDRLKSSFLANLSHEIRTPMNAIVGFANMLRDEETDAESIVRYSAIISQRSYDLLTIINDILDISKIEAGQMKVMEAPCDIRRLLDDLYISFKALWVDSGKVDLAFEKSYDTSGKLQTIVTDEGKLKQVLSNLLSNAFKFTREGQIRLECTMDEDQSLLFSVSDTGIGISADDLGIIFDRFRQVENTLSREFGGTGLGLSISKGLVELLGGKIWVDSTPGFGSTFCFTVPLKVTDAESEDQQAHPDHIIPLNGKPFHILVAEDDMANFQLISAFFKQSHVEIRHVNDGRSAIEQCQADPSIDLVLMDLKMPLLDGYEATMEIKKIRPELPVIAQTAFASEAERCKALECGCDDYVSKPFTRSLLLNAIGKYLK